MNVTKNAKAAAQEATSDLEQAAAAATAGLKEAATGLRDATAAAGEHLSDAGTAALRGARDLWDQTGDAIRNNPMAAVGIALAAGALLSRLLRR